jgi:hypothetical protein
MITKKQILKLILQIIVTIFTINISQKLAGYYNLDLFTVGFFTCVFLDIIWDISNYASSDADKCCK